MDDHSRVTYVEVVPDEKGDTTTGFLERALAWYAQQGVCVQRVMTDNGSAYRSRTFNRRLACGGVRHIDTRPYTPKTNGKAERFIQSLLREWSYAQPFPTSSARRDALPGWVARNNQVRPHGALSRQPPVTRLPTVRNNVVGFYI
jgi:transposase InsO family protein